MLPWRGGAQRAVTYARDDENTFRQMTFLRPSHADALRQKGRRDEAAAHFREEEIMRAKLLPEKPLLPALSGFHYCDLLLAASERAAWRLMLNLAVSQPSSFAESSRAVSERARQTLQWAEECNASLATIALDHLTLARAALCETVLEGGALGQLDSCRKSLERAVDGIRSASHHDFLPFGLLTRAWLRRLTGPLTGPESAQTDLDEAFEIAERGPMRLHLADIHLNRARLFGLTKDRLANYPWKSPQDDLAKARDFIQKCGYWRRKEQLEDAEAAVRQPS